MTVFRGSVLFSFLHLLGAVYFKSEYCCSDTHFTEGNACHTNFYKLKLTARTSVFDGCVCGSSSERMYVLSGDNVTLTCSLCGIQNGTEENEMSTNLHWTMPNGVNGDVMKSGRVLNMVDVGKEHSGKYVCEIRQTNSGGRYADQIIQVCDKDETRLVVDPDDLHLDCELVLENESAKETFNCSWDVKHLDCGTSYSKATFRHGQVQNYRPVLMEKEICHRTYCTKPFTAPSGENANELGLLSSNFSLIIIGETGLNEAATYRYGLRLLDFYLPTAAPVLSTHINGCVHISLHLAHQVPRESLVTLNVTSLDPSMLPVSVSFPVSKSYDRFANYTLCGLAPNEKYTFAIMYRLDFSPKWSGEFTLSVISGAAVPDSFPVQGILYVPGHGLALNSDFKFYRRNGVYFNTSACINHFAGETCKVAASASFWKITRIENVTGVSVQTQNEAGKASAVYAPLHNLGVTHSFNLAIKPSGLLNLARSLNKDSRAYGIMCGEFPKNVPRPDSARFAFCSSKNWSNCESPCIFDYSTVSHALLNTSNCGIFESRDAHPITDSNEICLYGQIQHKYPLVAAVSFCAHGVCSYASSTSWIDCNASSSITLHQRIVNNWLCISTGTDCSDFRLYGLKAFGIKEKTKPLHLGLEMMHNQCGLQSMAVRCDELQAKYGTIQLIARTYSPEVILESEKQRILCPKVVASTTGTDTMQYATIGVVIGVTLVVVVGMLIAKYRNRALLPKPVPTPENEIEMESVYEPFVQPYDGSSRYETIPESPVVKPRQTCDVSSFTRASEMVPEAVVSKWYRRFETDDRHTAKLMEVVEDRKTEPNVFSFPEHSQSSQSHSNDLVGRPLPALPDSQTFGAPLSYGQPKLGNTELRNDETPNPILNYDKCDTTNHAQPEACADIPPSLGLSPQQRSIPYGRRQGSAMVFAPTTLPEPHELTPPPETMSLLPNPDSGISSALTHLNPPQLGLSPPEVIDFEACDDFELFGAPNENEAVEALLSGHGVKAFCGDDEERLTDDVDAVASASDVKDMTLNNTSNENRPEDFRDTAVVPPAENRSHNDEQATDNRSNDGGYTAREDKIVFCDGTGSRFGVPSRHCVSP